MEAFKVKPQILREIPKFSPDYKPMTEAQKEELVQGILNRRAKEGGVEFGGAKIEPIVVGPDGVATPPASRVIEPRRNRTFTR